MSFDNIDNIDQGDIKTFIHEEIQKEMDALKCYLSNLKQADSVCFDDTCNSRFVPHLKNEIHFLREQLVSKDAFLKTLIQGFNFQASPRLTSNVNNFIKPKKHFKTPSSQINNHLVHDNSFQSLKSADDTNENNTI